MWDLPGPGIEPVSPVLAGEFLPLHHQGSPKIFKESSEHTLKMWDLKHMAIAGFLQESLMHRGPEGRILPECPSHCALGEIEKRSWSCLFNIM